jgi:hypothetical protein
MKPFSMKKYARYDTNIKSSKSNNKVGAFMFPTYMYVWQKINFQVITFPFQAPLLTPAYVR